MEIEYLQVEDVEELHELAIEMYGGTRGREKGKLEGMLGLPMSGFGDYERFPSIFEKGAVYHYYLASGHCFTDGNKRTAYLSAFTFLDLNGYDLIATDDEVYTWTEGLANDKKRPPFEEAVEWIKQHSHVREE